jgi:hypothetical protein
VAWWNGGMGTRIFACHVIPVPLFLRCMHCMVVFGGTGCAMASVCVDYGPTDCIVIVVSLSTACT